MNSKELKDISLIIVSTIFITFLVWIPYIFKLDFYGLNFQNGFDVILRNYDGLEYVIIAKSLYSPEIITSLPQSLPHTYYASHFPGYALLILFFAPFLGFLKSMVFISLAFTIGSAIAFYYLVKDFKMTNHPLLLSLIFLLLPARWLIVHSIGSSEPVFIFFIILALYFFIKFELSRKWVDIHFVGVFGLFAQLTRPPGILLFIALVFYIFWKYLLNKRAVLLKEVNNIELSLTFNKDEKNLIKRIFNLITVYHPLLLIPIALLLVFYWFHLAFNDFWAYFHSGDNIHLAFPPFQVFNIDQYWVGDIWLEEIVYIFIIGFLGGIALIKQKLYPLAFFVLTYMTASILVAHRDISRYALPAFPFILIAFEKVLTTKEFRIVLIIVALGIYLYAQNFILQNTAPYPNIWLFN